MKLKSRVKEYGICILIAGIFFAFLFGFEGTRTFLLFVLVYMVPTYLVLDLFEISEAEKVAFSFFISIGIFSSLVYFASFLLGSIKLAVGVLFFVMLAIALFFRRHCKKR